MITLTCSMILRAVLITQNNFGVKDKIEKQEILKLLFPDYYPCCGNKVLIKNWLYESC